MPTPTPLANKKIPIFEEIVVVWYIRWYILKPLRKRGTKSFKVFPTYIFTTSPVRPSSAVDKDQ